MSCVLQAGINNQTDNCYNYYNYNYINYKHVNDNDNDVDDITFDFDSDIIDFDIVDNNAFKRRLLGQVL